MKIDMGKLTLREKVLQTFVASAHDIRRFENMKMFFEQYPVGGVYTAKDAADMGKLMERDNITMDQFVPLCRKFSRYPLLVCADGMSIESGLTPCQLSTLGACNSIELAYDCGKAYGMQMNYNDIDWILSPCTDMDIFKHNNARLAYTTDDAKYNAELFSALIRGIQDRGVIATAKHFPGLGTNNVNSHLGPGNNVLDFNTWMDSFGYCYKEFFKQGCMTVMTAHIALESWSAEKENGYIPLATLSSKLTLGLLKEKLGFEGAVVTDALTMGACAFGNQIAASVQAFKAGADLLLWPPLEACDEIVKQLESGEIPMSRLEDALSRINKLRAFVDENKEKRVNVDPAFVVETAEKVLNGAPEIVRNEIGLLPLKKEEKKKVLVIGNCENEKDMKLAEEFSDILDKKGFAVDFQRHLLTCWQEEIHEICDPYDVIIFILSHRYAIDFHGGTEVDCGSSTWASHLVDMKKKIFVNFGLQYIAEDYYPGEHSFVNMNQPISKYAIELLADQICGEKEFTGKARLQLKKHNIVR